MTKNFIKDIISNEKKKGTKGLTHKLLNIPLDYNLNYAKSLQKIVKTPIGSTIINPVDIGERTYLVTKELKQHANSSLNLIRISNNYYKKKQIDLKFNHKAYYIRIHNYYLCHTQNLNNVQKGP